MVFPFIIMIGIIARLPQSFIPGIDFPYDGQDWWSGNVLELKSCCSAGCYCIRYSFGARELERFLYNMRKRIVGNKQYGGARQYIPLKVNAAGVMPIIFAQAIMFIPITFIGFSNVNDASGFVRAFTDHTSFWYNFDFCSNDYIVYVFLYCNYN